MKEILTQNEVSSSSLDFEDNYVKKLIDIARRGIPKSMSDVGEHFTADLQTLNNEAHSADFMQACILLKCDHIKMSVFELIELAKDPTVSLSVPLKDLYEAANKHWNIEVASMLQGEAAKKTTEWNKIKEVIYNLTDIAISHDWKEPL